MRVGGAKQQRDVAAKVVTWQSLEEMCQPARHTIFARHVCCNICRSGAQRRRSCKLIKARLRKRGRSLASKSETACKSNPIEMGGRQHTRGLRVLKLEASQ